MSLKWFCGFALLLSVALPVTALAESENGEHRLRPNSSVVNIFGWGKNQKAIMRQVDVREYDPETSISGEADPSPSQRLIPIPATEGNLTYVPEKLEPLRDRKLKEQRPADLYAAALFDELQSDNPAASVLAAERKVILDHYRDTAFKPLWTTPAGISERGREVLALFKGAPDEGLDTADTNCMSSAASTPRPTVLPMTRSSGPPRYRADSKGHGLCPSCQRRPRNPGPSHHLQ